MTTTDADVYYDPYDFEIDTDPYPIWRRLREEQPLYYNERYDFYALSRFDDVEPALGRLEDLQLGQGHAPRAHQEPTSRSRRARSSSRTRPRHDLHRGLLSRVFTPEEDERHRAEGAGVLRPQPRPARRRRRVRLHRRPRRPDADAHDRHAARHPRGRTRRRSATGSTTGSASRTGTMPDVDAGSTRRRAERARSPSTSTGGPSTRPTTS